MRYQLPAIAALSALLLSVSGVAQQTGELVVDANIQEEVAVESGRVIEVREDQISAPNQRVLILNQQPVQQQPVTNVEASPLTESRAAQIRRARKDAEIATEQKIVEKLEASRLEDERRRAAQLFGQSQQPVQVAPQPLQLAPAQQQVVPVQAQQQEESLADVKEDLINSVRAELKSAKEKEEESSSRTYMSALAGLTEYQDAINVDNQYAVGLAVGTLMDDGFSIEGTFAYSNFFIERLYWDRGRPLWDELDQYNFTIGAKYSPLIGKISPNVGVLVSYTYREYTEINDNAFRRFRDIELESQTDSVDMGLTLGLDLHIGDKFIIGGEYRYMTNLNTQRNSPYLNSRYRFQQGTPLEELDYSTFAIVGKVLF